MAEKIRVLLVEPMREPRMVDVEYTMENLHELVGGYLQEITPWETEAALVCDEDGKLKHYRPNRLLMDRNGQPCDIVVGSFFICGVSGGDFTSLSEEQEKWFRERFHWPEVFYLTGDEHVLWKSLKPGEKPRRIF